MKYVFLFLAILMCFSSVGCASATPVPPNATPEQIEQINAKNLEATAQNTATLNGITITSLIISGVSILISVISAGVSANVNKAK